MNLDQISQIWIIFFGCTAIWFVGRLEKWKRWGYILGLLSQPAWIYTSITNEQWGITVLSLFYTYSWCQGIYNYWIKKQVLDMEDKSFEFYKNFYKENRITLLQYASLRKHFKKMIEKILGKNYYNMEADVYSSDQMCCEDITKKLKSGIINRIFNQ